MGDILKIMHYKKGLSKISVRPFSNNVKMQFFAVVNFNNDSIDYKLIKLFCFGMFFVGMRLR